MADIPFLSIIVPVYNVEKYIHQCLESIIAQDFPDYEVILVDDGSTDTSGEICDRYTAKYSQFQCIHKANGGLPSARKCGYAASRGQYVTFVDSDDWIAPAIYSKMCLEARNTGADIVLCGHISAMADRELTCCMPFSTGFYDKKRLEREVYPTMIYSGTFFQFGISPNLWNKLFRRELLHDHLYHVPNDVAVGEDILASYSCILEASSVFILNEALYYYRSNADSMSRRTIPAGRLFENRKMFQTLQDVTDVTTYPYMQQQLYYFFVYQCLLTYVPVFKNMERSSSSRKLFLEECSLPLVRRSFACVPIRDIASVHNKLYAFCIHHKLFRLFCLLL